MSLSLWIVRDYIIKENRGLQFKRGDIGSSWKSYVDSVVRSQAFRTQSVSFLFFFCQLLANDNDISMRSWKFMGVTCAMRDRVKAGRVIPY